MENAEIEKELRRLNDELFMGNHAGQILLAAAAIVADHGRAMKMQDRIKYFERVVTAMDEKRTEMEALSDKLSLALDGCAKRLRVALSLVAGDAYPEFVTPAPSPLENIHAVSAALAEHQRIRGKDILSNDKSSNPARQSP